MTDDYFTEEEMNFLNTEEDGKTPLCAVIQQFRIGDTILLKTSRAYRSPFFLESQLIINLYALECRKRDR